MRSEIEEFARLLITEVRDCAVESCDMNLRSDVNAPVAKRWRGKLTNASAESLVKMIIPDCVDETLANLLLAVDSGRLCIVFRASNGNLVDLNKEGLGELAGWYMGSSDGWRAQYSQQRFVDDFEGLKSEFQNESEDPI
jgi:hypothetical protein